MKKYSFCNLDAYETAKHADLLSSRDRPEMNSKQLTGKNQKPYEDSFISIGWTKYI